MKINQLMHQKNKIIKTKKKKVMDNLKVEKVILVKNLVINNNKMII